MRGENMDKNFNEIKRKFHEETIEIAKKAIELLEALEEEDSIEDLQERIKHSEDVLRRMKQ